MEVDTSEIQTLQAALEALLETSSQEEAMQIVEQYPILLTDQADLLLSTIIASARKQGQENAAVALDERRDFLRGVRQELEDPDPSLN